MKYLIYGRPKYYQCDDYGDYNDDDYVAGDELLITALTKEEIFKREDDISVRYQITKLVPESTFFEKCITIEDRIYKILSYLKIKKNAFKSIDDGFTFEFEGYQADHEYVTDLLSDIFDCKIVEESVLTVDSWMDELDPDCDEIDYHISVYTFQFEKKKAAK